jgi:hypothetical protein
MKRGFYTIMLAQFFSSLADNALFIVAVQLLRSVYSPCQVRLHLLALLSMYLVM